MALRTGGINPWWRVLPRIIRKVLMGSSHIEEKEGSPLFLNNPRGIGSILENNSIA